MKTQNGTQTAQGNEKTAQNQNGTASRAHKGYVPLCRFEIGTRTAHKRHLVGSASGRPPMPFGVKP